MKEYYACVMNHSWCNATGVSMALFVAKQLRMEDRIGELMSKQDLMRLDRNLDEAGLTKDGMPDTWAAYSEHDGWLFDKGFLADVMECALGESAVFERVELCVRVGAKLMKKASGSLHFGRKSKIDEKALVWQCGYDPQDEHAVPCVRHMIYALSFDRKRIDFHYDDGIIVIDRIG